jgi:hypothetical protein
MVFKHSHSSHLPLILSGRNPNDRSPTSFLEKVPNHTAKDRGWDDPRQFKTKNDQIWMRSLFGLFGRQSRSMTKKTGLLIPHDTDMVGPFTSSHAGHLTAGISMTNWTRYHKLSMKAEWKYIIIYQILVY